MKMMIATFCAFGSFMMAVNAIGESAYNSSLLETKILNGIEHTTPLQYMASISFLFKLAGVLDFYHICGGFAANQKYIITVYECYKKIESCKGNNYEKFRVEVGVTNIHPSQTRNLLLISSVKKHLARPSKDIQMTEIYTIGIIVLEEEINNKNLNTNIMSIENPNPGKVCYTYGWGLRNFTKEEPETMSNQLMQLEVELDAVEFCRNKFIGSGFSDEFIMCGRPRKHTGRTMEGDYGGPLIHGGLIVGIAIPPGEINGDTSFFLKISKMHSKILGWISDVVVISDEK